MSSLEIGILTGLGTAICFGIGDFLIARSTRQYSGLYATFWVHLLRLSFVGLMFAGFGWHLKITELGMLLALVSGSILLAGQLAIFHSFKLGPVSIASPFVSGYALVASLLSIIFLHERLHPIQLFAIALLITGAMLASISSITHRPHKDFWRSPTVLWARSGFLVIS